MSDKFAIYRDIPKSHEIKIHRIDCTVYTNRDSMAKNSIWYTTPDLTTATDMAQKLAEEDEINYRHCKICKPSTPQFH